MTRHCGLYIDLYGPSLILAPSTSAPVQADTALRAAKVCLPAKIGPAVTSGERNKSVVCRIPRVGPIPRWRPKLHRDAAERIT